MDTAFPLLSARPIELRAEPFLHGVGDAWLSEECYSALCASFIDPARHPRGEQLGRGKRRIVFRAPPLPAGLLGEENPWTHAVRSICEPAFAADCLAWMRGSGFLEQQPAGPYRALLAERLRVDPSRLEWQFEFSALERGALLPPHSDSTDKLLSAILYLPPPRWEAEWGGSTEFYAPLDPRQRHNWGNAFLPRDAVRARAACAFRPNRLCLFPKGHAAWHGVSAIDAPAGVQRRSFNLSLVIPQKLGRGAAWVAAEAEIRRLEAQVFGAA